MLRNIHRVSQVLRSQNRLLSDRKFPSILDESKVVSPFADPTRTRMSTSPPTLASNPTVLKATTSNITIEDAQAKMVHSSASPLSAAVGDVPPIIASTKKVPEKEEVLPPKMSALEELASLKESVEKMKEQDESGGSDGKPGDDHSEEAQKRRERMARNTKIGMGVVFGGAVAGFIGFCLYYGRSQRDESGNLIKDEFSGIFAPFYRIASSIKLWRDYVVEPAREKLLPDPMQAPYHQPKYTLVIEMKNVLVSPEWTYKTGYRFIKRPALDYFLDVVGYPNFEVVIYSSESNFTGPAVVDSFDPKQRIMFKLFRDCTKYKNGHHLKDLSKLNRDLSKVIYIDFDPNSFQLNPQNVLRVPKWDGDMTDTALVDLAELLKTIHLSDVEDVRDTLQYYSSFDDPAKEFRKRALFLAQQEQEKNSPQSDNSLLKRYSGKLFGFRRHAST